MICQYLISSLKQARLPLFKSFLAEATPFSSAIEFLATFLGYIFVLNNLALNKISFIRVLLTLELF